MLFYFSHADSYRCKTAISYSPLKDTNTAKRYFKQLAILCKKKFVEQPK